MKRRRFLASFLVTVSGVLAPLAAEQSETVRPPATLQMGIVQNADEFAGFGCRLQLAPDYGQRNDRYVFVSDADEEAIINIDGSDVRLYRVGFESGAGNNSSRFVDLYRKNELDVRVDLRVTKRCEPSDENCEVTLFDAVITVTRGVAKETVPTKGFCGS